MQFTLQYDGVLLSAQRGRVENQCEMRLGLAPSIRELWRQSRELRWLRAHEGDLSRLRRGSWVGNGLRIDPLTGGMAGPFVSSPFPYVELNGLKYIMLVNQLNEWRCDVEIKALVPEAFRGDHDNRQKTICDALRPPQNLDQVRPTPSLPSPPHDLVFCLVEDDSMIGNRRFECEPLLKEIPGTIPAEQRPNYVSLLMSVALTDSRGGPIRVAGAP